MESENRYKKKTLETGLKVVITQNMNSQGFPSSSFRREIHFLSCYPPLNRL